MKKPASAWLTLVLIIAAGQSAFAADLIAVYREATLQDAAYAAAKARYIAAQERLPQGRALLLPNVNFGAGSNYNDVDAEYTNSTLISGTRDFYDYNYGVTLSQPPYRSQNAVIYEQAKIQVRQAQALYNTILNQLRLKAAVGELAEADLADINALLKDDSR